jgi:hypothetical protein
MPSAGDTVYHCGHISIGFGIRFWRYADGWVGLCEECLKAKSSVLRGKLKWSDSGALDNPKTM